MAEPRSCPECGAQFFSDVPEGLCPACLIMAGLGSDTLPDMATIALPQSPQSVWPITEASRDESGEATSSHEEENSPSPTELFDRTPVESTLARASGPGVMVRYFGDYEILEELGRGGMGVVYKARQVNLNRLVALKMILSGQLAGEDEVRRFYLEAEAAAGLDHPGIVPVYEVGEYDGQHYFSMRYVEGRSLAREVASGPLQPGEAAALVLQVAEAVQYAHDRGVIHRDIKPSNILLDDRRRARVTDFGLAKLIRGDSSLTRSGAVLGSPGYMPPEQAGSVLAVVSPSSDVFSLGATLYCLLTGRPPFQGASAMETIRRTLENDPTPPRRISPSLPRDLDTICLKCLRKAPADRYASARDLAEDLARHLSGRAILARPVSQTERAWLWARRYPTVAGLSASLMVLILVTTLALALAFKRPPESRSTAVEKVEKSRPPTATPLVPAQGILTFELPNPRVRVEFENGGQLVGVSGSGNQEVQLLPGRRRMKVIQGGDQLREETLEIAPGGRQSIEPILPITSKPANSASQPGFSSGGVLPPNFSTESLLVTDHGGHQAAVRSLLFTPSGSRLLSGGLDKVIRVWDVDGGPRLERTIRPPIWKGYRGQVHAMALSPVVGEGNQRTLAVAGHGVSAHLGEILLYRYPGRNSQGTGDMITQLPPDPAADGRPVAAHSGVVTSLAFTPDGRFLASAGADRTVRIWDVAAPGLVSVLTESGAEVNALAIFANGTRLASAGNDGYLRLYDITNRSQPILLAQAPPGPGAAGAKPTPLTSRISALGVSPDDRWIVTGTEGGSLRRFDAATLGNPVVLPSSPDGQTSTGAVLALALSRDGRFLATSLISRNLEDLSEMPTVSSAVQVRSMPDGAILENLPTTSNLVQAIAFSPDSQRLAYAGGDFQEITVRESSAWNAPPVQLKGHSGAVWHVGFSPDSRRIHLSRAKSPTPGQADGSVSFDLLERAVSHRDLGEPSRQAQVSWADWTLRPIDPHQLVCLKGEGHVGYRFSLDPVVERRWLAYTIIPPAPGHPQPVVAVATYSGAIVLWNLVTSSKTRCFNAHTGPVYTLATSPDGKWLASGSSDQTVRLWPLTECDRRPPFGARFDKTADGTWVVVDVTPGSFADGIGLKKDLVLDKLYVGDYGPPVEIAPSLFDRYLSGLDLESPTKMFSFMGRMPGVALPFQAATSKRDSSCLSLLLGADDEWVIWTPQGYYDSSIRGDESLGWHRNMTLSSTSPVRHATEFVPARMFEGSIRRPKLIDELIRTADFGRLVNSGQSTNLTGWNRLAILSVDSKAEVNGGKSDFLQATQVLEQVGVLAGYRRIESRYLVGDEEASTERRVRQALDDLNSPQGLGQGDQLIVLGDLRFAIRPGRDSMGQSEDFRVAFGETLRGLSSRGCRVIFLGELISDRSAEVVIRDWVRSLTRDGVIVVVVTADGSDRPRKQGYETLARGVIETFDRNLANALMAESRGVLPLDSFLDRLGQAITKVSGGHRSAHSYIPQAVSPKSPFMNAPPAPRAVESVGGNTKPGR